MAVRLRRKIYARGGSFETTIPLQLLFAVDMTKKQEIVFEYDARSNRWYTRIEEYSEHPPLTKSVRKKSASSSPQRKP